MFSIRLAVTQEIHSCTFLELYLFSLPGALPFLKLVSSRRTSGHYLGTFKTGGGGVVLALLKYNISLPLPQFPFSLSVLNVH
jgi:hypothetical protein